MRGRSSRARERRTGEVSGGHDGYFGECVGEAERGEDSPCARPDAHTRGAGGEEVVRSLVEVDFNVVVARERDGADQAPYAASAGRDD